MMTSGKKSMEGENKYSLFLNIKSDNGIDVLNTFEDEVSCLVFSLFNLIIQINQENKTYTIS